MATNVLVTAVACHTARTVASATRDLVNLIGEMSLGEKTPKKAKRSVVDIEDDRHFKKQCLPWAEPQAQSGFHAGARLRATRCATRHRDRHVLSTFRHTNQLSIAPINYEFRFDFRITPVRASDAIREVQRQQYPEFRRPKSSPSLRPSAIPPIDPNDYVELDRHSLNSVMHGLLSYYSSVDPPSPIEHFGVSNIDGFEAVGQNEGLPCYKPRSNQLPSDAIFNAYPRAAIGLPPIARPTRVIANA